MKAENYPFVMLTGSIHMMLTAKLFNMMVRNRTGLSLWFMMRVIAQRVTRLSFTRLTRPNAAAKRSITAAPDKAHITLRFGCLCLLLLTMLYTQPNLEGRMR